MPAFDIGSRCREFLCRFRLDNGLVAEVESAVVMEVSEPQLALPNEIR